MASASTSLALIALLVASCAAWASAASFTVGDTQGWTTSGVDYTNWASSKTFAVGDTLVFNYASKVHTVTEVSQSDYNSCSGSNALSNDDSGSTSITLKTPGTHYFICTTPGHCAAGMKLAVNVGGSGPGIPGTPTNPSGPIPSGAGALAPASSMFAAVTGLLIKIALF